MYNNVSIILFLIGARVLQSLTDSGVRVCVCVCVCGGGGGGGGGGLLN